MIRLPVNVIREAEGEAFGEKVEGTYTERLGRFNFLEVPRVGEKLMFWGENGSNRVERWFQVVDIAHYPGDETRDIVVGVVWVGDV